MKPLVIYHANCTDGFGAAFAAWLKLGDEAEYIPMNYGEVETLEDFDMKVSLAAKGNDIYILDFSFPHEVMVALFQHAKRVVWLDHHKTAFEMWCKGVPEKGWICQRLNCTEDNPSGNVHIELNNNKSGALLAWEYFHPITKVPMLIQHIDDRDRWQFKMDGSKELHAALRSYEPWTFEQWWRLFYDKPGLGTYKRANLIQEGAAILRAHNQHVQSALKQAKTCAIRWDWKEVCGTVGYREAVGYSANAPAFLTSDLGHELANKSGTFGLVWSMAGDGQIHCSLRSNGDYDVSAIAKAFGGGGHRNAAGFSTDINTLVSWLK